MRIKILLDHEQALFFSQSVDICKREKIPTYMSGGIRQRLKLALVLHILPQELKGKIRDHSRFAEAYQYKDFPLLLSTWAINLWIWPSFFTPDCLGVPSGDDWGEAPVFADYIHWPGAVV